MPNNSITENKESKENKPVAVLFTDIQLHSNKSNNPKTFKRKIEKGIKVNKAGRYYGGKIKVKENGEFELFIELPKEASDKNLIYALPESGLDIFLGKDAKEKIKSLKKKKIY